MKKIRMCFPNEKTFREGFEEYILDCKARNLRDGTINHYQESMHCISSCHLICKHLSKSHTGERKTGTFHSPVYFFALAMSYTALDNSVYRLDDTKLCHTRAAACQ